MRITKPSRSVFYISLILAVLALLLELGVVSLGVSAFWLMAIAYLILFLGVAMKSL